MILLIARLSVIASTWRKNSRQSTRKSSTNHDWVVFRLSSIPIGWFPYYFRSFVGQGQSRSSIWGRRSASFTRHFKSVLWDNSDMQIRQPSKKQPRGREDLWNRYVHFFIKLYLLIKYFLLKMGKRIFTLLQISITNPNQLRWNFSNASFVQCLMCSDILPTLLDDHIFKKIYDFNFDSSGLPETDLLRFALVGLGIFDLYCESSFTFCWHAP